MNKIFILLATVLFSFIGLNAQDGLPPNPVPGKCYVKCTTADEFKNETVKVMTAPAYQKLTVVPAEYKTVEERVMVKPATKKFIYHPAVFTTYTDDYEAVQPYNKLAVVPTTLKASSETIVVSPKSAGWEYGAKSPDCSSPNPEDCRVLCYVEYAEVKETIPTKVIDVAAATKSTVIPGKSATVTKQKITKDAYVEEIEIPAEYKTITKKVLVKDETSTSVDVAAVYENVTKEVLVKKGGVTVWEEIACELTEFNIINIYYEFNSAKLTPASKKVIDEKLYKLLAAKPNISIELNSHTDSRGSSAANLALSQARAKSVVDYLVSQGIKKSRLVSKGYGESKLVNKCADGVSCTEEQHQKNRRTEFRVISK